MIKLLRVDHRLLHGQVAFSWVQQLGIDSILIANDALMNDELQKTTIKLAKPNNIKLVMKNIEDSIQVLNSGVTDSYKLFIVVHSIKDAYRIAIKVPTITTINLGGIKESPNLKAISKTIYVSPEDIEMLKELETKNITSFIQQVPTDQKILIKDIINKI